MASVLLSFLPTFSLVFFFLANFFLAIGPRNFLYSLIVIKTYREKFHIVLVFDVYQHKITGRWRLKGGKFPRLSP